MSTTLLMVDVQRNMLEPPDPVPDARAVSAAIADVLGRARDAGWTVVHIRNTGSGEDPDVPGTPGWELVHEVRPGEHVVDKPECDAFDGTGLGEIVDPSARVVVVGMQSEFCVRATGLAALRRGNSVRLVTDAHATYDGDLPASERSRRVSAELADAGAELVRSAELTRARN